MPDVFAVLPDRPVGGEFPHPGHIQDRHLRPFLFVPETGVYPVLAVDVGLVVGEQQVVVVAEKLVDQRLEQAAVARGEVSRRNPVDNLLELRIPFVVAARIVPPRLQLM